MTYWLRKQGFVICLLAVLVLAFFWPGLVPLEKDGVAKITTNLAVALVFFLQGLSLATRQMLAGFRPLRLHLFVLGWNFILFPAVAWLLSKPVSSFLGPELSMGLWMLAILPTTIASATALTVASRGAVPQAIFASIFSNLLAIFLVPLLALAYLSGTSGVEVPLVAVFTKLCLIILWPLMLGQFVRRYFYSVSIRICKRLHWLPQAAILYIVYVSFAQTVASDLLKMCSLRQIVVASGAVIILLLLSSYWVWQSAKWTGLKRSERVTAFFCGSQKSIATGLPLLTTTLAVTSVDAGLVLMPLLLYHSLQLLLGGVLSAHFANESEPNSN